MNIKEDFSLHQHKEEVVNWDDDVKEKMTLQKPTASYNPLSNKLRQAIPEDQLCSMFCGGKKCKYCNPVGRFEKEVMVIDGLYSAWVTESILAMSRPCTRLINEFKVVEQFKEKGIRSVINLQRPGEHASCGDPLQLEGFSYSPQTFMDNDIFFYNFGWKDYGVTSMRTVLDMVRVMQFALSEGGVAVHCHAGLGRTGVIIACYLVFNNRLGGEEAVHYVRAKRPGALQTQEQVNCVIDFCDFMKPLRCVFANRSDTPTFNLNECLRRQSFSLHGYEGRRLKYLPKIIYICCERLLDISLQRAPFYLRSPKRNILATPNIEERRRSLRFDAAHAFDKENYVSPRNSEIMNDRLLELPEPSNDLRRSASDQGLTVKANNVVETNNVTRTTSSSIERQLSIQSSMSDSVCGQSASAAKPGARRIDDRVSTEDMSPDVQRVVEAFLEENPPDDVKETAEQWKSSLNDEEGTWMRLAKEENDPRVLARLVLDWMEHLKTPIIRPQDIQVLGKPKTSSMESMKLLERSVSHMLHYIALFIVKLQPVADDLDEALVFRLLGAFTHQEIQMNLNLTTRQSQTSLASVSGTPSPMRPQMANTLIRFFYSLVDTLEREDGLSDAMSVASFNLAGQT